jgi:hypothetical protein
MSIGFVSYDGKRAFYAEFTDYAQSQMDHWLKENVVDRFILTDMSDRTHKESGKTQFFKGDLDWVVSHPKGLKNWLQSFGEKIVLAASGGTYDWVVFRTMMKIKYVEDMPEYIDSWPIDVVSLLRWEGYAPEEEYFKENFTGASDHSNKHNALEDARVIRDVYLKLETERFKRYVR